MQRISSNTNKTATIKYDALNLPILSVIMPVYNVDQYLRQSIDSILKQTLGFSQNIELILVNDGSTDGTVSICREYKELYPNNIIFVSQKNKGVSAARNKGLKKASGKYVNFFDGDDVWSSDAFKGAVEFLESQSGRVDFVTFKIKFFDRIIDSHPGNYKFKKTRAIDLNTEPDNPIFHLPTCVFRRKALVGKSFDERLKITEDAKFLSEVLHDKKSYGVSARGCYNYRKRQNESSAIGGQQRNRDYYLLVPDLAYKYMLDKWSDDKGNIHKFMQYEILSDLSWRLPQSSQDVLTRQEENVYRQSIKAIVSRLDDDVIIKKAAIPLQYKIFLLRMKHGAGYDKLLGVRDGSYYFGKELVCRVGEGMSVVVDFIRPIGEGLYKIEGYISQVGISRDDKYLLKVSDKTYRLKRTERAQRVVSFLGDTIYEGGGFEVAIQLEGSRHQSIAAKVVTNNGYETTLPMGANNFTGLSNIPTSYHRYGNLVIRKEKGQIEVYSYSPSLILRFELRHWLGILFSWKLGEASVHVRKLSGKNLKSLSLKKKVFEVVKPLFLVLESVWFIPQALMLRSTYFIMKKSLKKPVWIISDRGMAAGDNGEALFRYVRSLEKVEADVYYAISEKSIDYNRLKQYGPVLGQGSLKYKLKFLLSSKIISSQADFEITNPFLRQIDKYLDLFEFDFIFLQHGIIRHDLSSWLNRYDKNIRLFITSARKEYESILSYPYYYDKRSVILTGLPRYDYLDSNPAGRLIIAPTYRKGLVRFNTDTNGARRYDPSFKHSDYCKFYSRLMSDTRLVEALSSHSMTGEFYLHPAFAAQVSDFQSSDKIQVMDFPYNYSRAFNLGNLLVTDYSSIVFDFAYLRKPVIYSQFDVDKFYNQQAYDKGDFFSDDRNGFGNIAYDYEALISEIINNIEDGCVMPDKYIKRIGNFFYKTDKNNSRRVYEAIISVPDK